MRLLYATDLHGDKNKHELVIRLATQYEVSAIVIGGDFLPTEEEIYAKQDRFVKEYLPDFFQRVGRLGIPYLFCPGNDDLKVFDPIINELTAAYANVHMLSATSVRIGTCPVPYLDNLVDRCKWPQQQRNRLTTWLALESVSGGS